MVRCCSIFVLPVPAEFVGKKRGDRFYKEQMGICTLWSSSHGGSQRIVRQIHYEAIAASVCTKLVQCLSGRDNGYCTFDNEKVHKYPSSVEVVDSNDLHFYLHCRFCIFLLPIIPRFPHSSNFNDTEGKRNCIIYCRSLAFQGKEPQVKGN